MIKKDILFVTAFKNINRENWKSYKRTQEEYLLYFDYLITNIKYNIVVFIEENLLEKLILKYKKYNNILLFDINLVDSFYKKYLLKDKEIMKSNIYKNKIPNNRKNNPEHNYSEYNLITHSKINFVKKACELFNNYDFYSWIDFGFIRNPNSNFLPKNINTNLLSTNKILYQAFFIPKNKTCANKMLQSNKICICGGAFIIHKSLIYYYEKLFEQKIIEWQKNYISDDEQNLVLQLYFDNPQLFNLKISNKWFNFFNLL